MRMAWRMLKLNACFLPWGAVRDLYFSKALHVILIAGGVENLGCHTTLSYYR